MTKKEIKKVAKELVKLEKIIQSTEDNDARYRAEMAVMTLTSKVEDMEDMMAIDELVMELLEQENWFSKKNLV